MADESDNGSFELKLSGALDPIDEADELGDFADILTTKYGRPTEVMIFLDAVKTCFKKWSAWEGRASRSESNWFYLLQLLVILPLYISLEPIEAGGCI